MEDVYLYHRKKDDFQGGFIMTLNEVRKRFPEIYAREVRKYDDRPFLLDRRIEPLDALWNDVIHLSPIHPQKVRDALQEAGYKNIPHREYFKIPLKVLDPKKMVYHVSSRDRLNPMLTERPPNFEELSKDLPEQTKEHYKDQHKRGDSPLLYSGTLHVLYKGKINIKDAEIIKV